MAKLLSRRRFLGDIADRLALRGNGAVIGVGSGRFCSKLRERWHGTMLYCIDPWELRGDATLPGGTGSKALLGGLRRKAYKGMRAKHNLDTFELAQGFSAEEKTRFPLGSLDLVYFDAQHNGRASYEAFKEDLLDWLPRVRQGGLIMGLGFCDPRRDACVVARGGRASGSPDPPVGVHRAVMEVAGALGKGLFVTAEGKPMERSFIMVR